MELDKEDAKKCEVNLSGEFNFVETINLSQTDLPKDVLSLVSIKPEIGATVSIILKVDPSDIIAVDVEYLNFKDVKVKFPKFIKFKETDENNVLIINEYYKPTLNNRNFKKQLVIESIDFSVLNAKHLPVNDGHILQIGRAHV